MRSVCRRVPARVCRSSERPGWASSRASQAPSGDSADWQMHRCAWRRGRPCRGCCGRRAGARRRVRLRRRRRRVAHPVRARGSDDLQDGFRCAVRGPESPLGLCVCPRGRRVRRCQLPPSTFGAIMSCRAVGEAPGAGRSRRRWRADTAPIATSARRMRSCAADRSRLRF